MQHLSNALLEYNHGFSLFWYQSTRSFCLLMLLRPSFTLGSLFILESLAPTGSMMWMKTTANLYTGQYSVPAEDSNGIACMKSPPCASQRFSYWSQKCIREVPRSHRQCFSFMALYQIVEKTEQLQTTNKCPCTHAPCWWVSVNPHDLDSRVKHWWVNKVLSFCDFSLKFHIYLHNHTSNVT